MQLAIRSWTYVMFLFCVSGLSAVLQTDGISTVVQAAADVRLTSFDWHTKCDNRLLVVGNNGALADVFLTERSAIVSIQTVFICAFYSGL
jgi:hypothetical protein